MKALPEPQGGRVRDEVGHSDGGERREDRAQPVLGPQGDLRPLERPGAGDHRGGEGGREVHARSARRTTSSSSATTGRRRSTAGSAPARRTRRSRSRRRCTPSSRSTTRSRRSRRQVQGRHEDRPRQQDRARCSATSRTRSSRPVVSEGERQRPERSGATTRASELVPERESGRLPVQPPAAEAGGDLEVVRADERARRTSPVASQPGECHALVGRNGAGKSTLVGVLTGLLKPDRGAVRLYGEPAPSLGDRAAWQERVACVYQRSMVDPVAERRREHLPQPQRAGRSSAGDRAAAAGPGAAARVGVRPRRRPARGRALGRAEADRRDRAGPLDRRALPDPRRADRVARVERDRAAVRARPPDEGERRRDPLHLAPPRGDLRDLRHRHRAPRREADRHRARRRARPRAPRRGDGRRRARPRRRTRSPGATATAPSRLELSRALGPVAARRRRTTSASRCAPGECVGLFGLRGSGSSRRRRRRRRSREAGRRHDLARRSAARRRQGRLALSPAASRTCPRTGTRAASCRRSACART